MLLDLRSLLSKVAVLDEKTPDPKSPFEFRYESRGLLESALAAADASPADASTEQLQLARGLLLFKIGANLIDCEEFGSGETRLLQSIALLEPALARKTVPADGPTCSLPSAEGCLACLVDAYNYMGILWSVRGEYEESLHWLKKAEQSSGGENLQTVFYMAQVYGRLNEPEQSAKYCRACLKMQLASSGGVASLNKQEWSDNAMYLSGYYLNRLQLTECEHCLRAAEKVLQLQSQVEHAGQWQELNEISRANINLAWARYCLELLKLSRDSLPSWCAHHDCEPPVIPSQSPLTELSFSVELDIPPASSSVRLVETFESARDLFKVALLRFTRAAEIYVLDGFVTEHVAIVQDVSRLYKILAAFENPLQMERLLAMHQRRASNLEPLVQALNPEHYRSPYRQMVYELGEIYSEMTQLHLQQQHQQQQQQLGTISSASTNARTWSTILKACEYFDKFIASYSAASDGSSPDSSNPLAKRWPLEAEEALLLAEFHKAHLLAKLPDKPALEQAVKGFSFVTDYARIWSVPSLVGEVEVAREMAELLPLKIQTMMQDK